MPPILVEVGDDPDDGRRARREPGRRAVVDAAFALILEGKAPFAVQDVCALIARWPAGRDARVTPARPR